MAYSTLTLFTASGIYNATGYGEAVAIHTYTTSDLVSIVSTPGYFPNNFGVNEDQIRINDILILMTGDFNTFTKVTSLSPVGIVAFLDFPSNVVTDSSSIFSTTVQGVWASPIPIDINVYQQNKLCVLTFPPVLAAATGGPLITFGDLFPESCRPALDTSGGCGLINNSLNEIGGIVVITDGTAFIARSDGSPFSASGNAGFNPFTFIFMSV